MGWKNKPSNFALEILTKTEHHAKRAIGDALQQVVIHSPVDTGAYRFSHIVSINSPDYSAKNGQGDVFAANAMKIASFELGDIAFIQNNSKQAIVIEFGGYPNPVKKGTWVKGKGKSKGYYKILSVNGFSRQAPQGVYALAFQYLVSKYT